MQSLAEAAQLRLLLGQMRKYCETMCTLGHWERAIAISPALGVDYWRSLLRRYNQHLLQSVEDNNGGSGSTQCTAASQALFPFLLAAGDASSLVDYLCSGNQQPICPAADKNNSLQLAYLLASAVDAGMFEANSASGTAPQTASAAANSNGAFTAPRLQAAANGGRLPSLRPTEPSKATEALAEMRPFSAPVPAVANCNTNNPQALTNRVITHATHQFPSISAAEQSLETVEDCRDSYSSKMAAAWLLAGDDRRAAIQRLLDGRVYDHAYALAAVFNMPEFCERIESAMHRYQPT
jgi:hypothetical protein